MLHGGDCYDSQSFRSRSPRGELDDALSQFGGSNLFISPKRRGSLRSSGAQIMKRQDSVYSGYSDTQSTGSVIMKVLARNSIDVRSKKELRVGVLAGWVQHGVDNPAAEAAAQDAQRGGGTEQVQRELQRGHALEQVGQPLRARVGD